METVDQHESINKSKSKRRRTVSRAELYTVLEALLPFAKMEIECLADFVETFPNDPDHTDDALQARLGQETIESAKRLIAQKTLVIRHQQKAFKEQQKHTNA